MCKKHTTCCPLVLNETVTPVLIQKQNVTLCILTTFMRHLVIQDKTCLLKCRTISCREGLVKVFCTVWHNSTQQFQSNLHHFRKPIYVDVKQNFFLHFRRWDIQVDRLKTVFVKFFFICRSVSSPCSMSMTAKYSTQL